jgi:hypothetical protein
MAKKGEDKKPAAKPRKVVAAKKATAAKRTLPAVKGAARKSAAAKAAVPAKKAPAKTMAAKKVAAKKVAAKKVPVKRRPTRVVPHPNDGFRYELRLNSDKQLVLHDRVTGITMEQTLAQMFESSGSLSLRVGLEKSIGTNRVNRDLVEALEKFLNDYAVGAILAGSTTG